MWGYYFCGADVSNDQMGHYICLITVKNVHKSLRSFYLDASTLIPNIRNIEELPDGNSGLCWSLKQNW